MNTLLFWRPIEICSVVLSYCRCPLPYLSLSVPLTVPLHVPVPLLNTEWNACFSVAPYTSLCLTNCLCVCVHARAFVRLCLRVCATYWFHKVSLLYVYVCLFVCSYMSLVCVNFFVLLCAACLNVCVRSRVCVCLYVLLWPFIRLPLCIY